jgi:hypothetical protein
VYVNRAINPLLPITVNTHTHTHTHTHTLAGEKAFIPFRPMGCEIAALIES